jgi:alkaline phosphatase D
MRHIFVMAAIAVALWVQQATAAPPATVPAIAPLPAADAVIERIAFGSCADQRHPQPFWTTIGEAEPQLVVMLGDNVYGDVSSAEMTELRTAYAALGAQPGFQRLRATVPFLAVWDDHDFGVNDGGGDFPYRLQSEALFRAFWSLPPGSGGGADEGLYQAYLFGPPGRRLQLILLDTRSFRSPLKPTDQRGARGRERYLPDPDPEKTMLGEAQWQWLAARLREPADLRVIISSIQVLADSHGWERWGNLPHQRERLLRLIGETGAGSVVFISGDRHFGALYRRADGLPYPLYEITASSLNRPFLATREQDARQISEPYRWGNFGVALIDWQTRRLRLELRDWNGAVALASVIDLAELQPR